jgi:hypothetical protein
VRPPTDAARIFITAASRIDPVDPVAGRQGSSIARKKADSREARFDQGRSFPFLGTRVSVRIEGNKEREIAPLLLSRCAAIMRAIRSCLEGGISDQLVIRLAVLPDFQPRRAFSGFSLRIVAITGTQASRRSRLNKRPLKLHPTSASSAPVRSRLFRINLLHQPHRAFLLCHLSPHWQNESRDFNDALIPVR